ncbi:Ig-like domain-containing protein [Staphylococcus chromogenes]|nr:Ig-like domain-containing protein [Staphylococcus chromogenes]
MVYSTEDTQYATVDENTGEVTGVSEGVATITATAQDGSGQKQLQQ